MGELQAALEQVAELEGGRRGRGVDVKPNRARRLLRHQDELFQFLLVPGLPAHNNPVERSLRPLVIMRKISGGTRSPAGSQTRLTLASVFDTWTARHLNPFRQCLAALQRPTANAPP